MKSLFFLVGIFMLALTGCSSPQKPAEQAPAQEQVTTPTTDSVAEKLDKDKAEIDKSVEELDKAVKELE